MKFTTLTCSSVGTCILGLAAIALPILQVIAVLMSITLSYFGLKTYFENRRSK